MVKFGNDISIFFHLLQQIMIDIENVIRTDLRVEQITKKCDDIQVVPLKNGI